MNLFEKCAFHPADILIPKDADMSKWSVVACDQYTSQPEYWAETERFVGGAPSTLRLTLPEIFLEDDFDKRIGNINRAMGDYIAHGIFAEAAASFVYLERVLPGSHKHTHPRVRKGLVGMLDLEAYDYAPGSKNLARATEGTVVERIPARVRIRENAPLETPHIMMLIDDPARTVIEPFAAMTNSLDKLYDFDLMQNGGHSRGYRVTGSLAQQAAQALCALLDTPKYGGGPAFLYAAGDGNHSLASAKAHYETIKATLPAGEAARHPARYALCELVNIYDDSLTFEPIHRVVFGVDADALHTALLACEDFSADSGASWFETVYQGKRRRIYTGNPLALADLQGFLDQYIAETGAKIDYVHGEDVTARLAHEPGNVGFLLQAIEKDGFFPSVAREGALPRKTFSMGEAHEKRYYLECRKIK